MAMASDLEARVKALEDKVEHFAQFMPPKPAPEPTPSDTGGQPEPEPTPAPATKGGRK